MKLYYSPGACSLASHIALFESGLKFTTEPVNLGTLHYKGGDFKKINPKGYVPFIEMDDGQTMAEGAVILQWIADQAPQTHLIPKAGTMERYRCQEWLNYIATEIHKTLGNLFAPDMPAEARAAIIQLMEPKFEFLANHLKNGQFLMGEYTVADAYLFTILDWTKPLKVDLSKWPALLGYMEKVGNRPATKEALKAEGMH